MASLTFTAASLSDTDRLGAALVQVLPDCFTVGLVGPLGAGKTRLVQAMAAAIGLPREHVVSPTFVLCQHYEARRTIYHMDAYRLRDDDEFLGLGPEEYFAAPALTVVEWADRVERCLPPDRLMIEVEVLGDDARQFQLTPHGEIACQALRELQTRLTSGLAAT
jgi:tRNA threonylcarbamoyladenosine biosynthesis protein TsaE